MTKQTIEQLQQSINTLQKQLDELKQQPPSKVSMWKPDEYEKYFLIRDGYGIINSFHDGGQDDYDLLTCGNCFPTRELAEYYAKKRAARQRLEMLALVENGMVPYEWTVNCPNFYLTACSDISIDQHCTVREDHQYFPTRAAAQHVLDAMTDEDCLLLWGTANRGGK